MSQSPLPQADPSIHNTVWESRLRQIASAFPYPPTPRLAGQISARADKARSGRLRFVQAGAALLLLLVVLMAVPQVRAEVQRILQIGVIRVFFGEETPTAVPVVEPTSAASPAAGSEQPRPTARPTRTPRPEPTPLTSVLDLPGETTLAGAQERTSFPIGLPTYPPDLGEPDRVFAFDTGDDTVALVWLDPQDPAELILSLFEFAPGSDVWKRGIDEREELVIDGAFALWTDDPHLSIFTIEGYGEVRREVTQAVLIWVGDPTTYRLEGDITQEEAIRIAQSIP